MTELGAAWNIVHTIDDWYDGPRAGAADYDGRSYWYRSVYLDTPEYNHEEDRFELTPMTPEALGWELERKHIFDRWESARRLGSIVWNDGDLDSFGAFPEDMDLCRELNKKMEFYLANTKPTHLLRGEFEPGRVRWKAIT
jgi:hypothetical protein